MSATLGFSFLGYRLAAIDLKLDAPEGQPSLETLVSKPVKWFSGKWFNRMNS